jgi:hypothetical protein
MANEEQLATDTASLWDLPEVEKEAEEKQDKQENEEGEEPNQEER